MVRLKYNPVLSDLRVQILCKDVRSVTWIWGRAEGDLCTAMIPPLHTSVDLLHTSLWWIIHLTLFSTNDELCSLSLPRPPSTHNHIYAQVAPLLQGHQGGSNFALKGPILKSLLLAGTLLCTISTKSLIEELTDNGRTSCFPLTKMSFKKLHASENHFAP